ncbi:MAG: serine kinase [Candidatus Hydrogenedentes bacterium]|nr:serine kinase [Candidatus Hydrogenedentota bacterium]
MSLKEMADALGLECLTPEVSREGSRPVAGGYSSDLLSDVLAHAPRGGVLITIQVHMNVIAVAVHAELSAVIFASGRHPGEDVRAMAAKEGIALCATPDCAFDVSGRLYEAGLRGTHDEARAQERVR